MSLRQDMKARLLMEQSLFLEDRESQDKAMRLLCQKYMPDKMAFVQTSVDFERKHLNTYAIGLEQISAKAKYFDT